MNLKTLSIGKLISKCQRVFFDWSMSVCGIRENKIEDFYHGSGSFNETDWKELRYPYVFAVPIPMNGRIIQYRTEKSEELFSWLMENTTGMFQWAVRINKENKYNQIIIDIVVAFDDEDDVMLFKLVWFIDGTMDISREMKEVQ